MLDSGEVVDLVVHGATVAYLHAGRTHLRVPGSGDDHGNPDYVSLDLTNPAITVTRAIPSDGQPQPGDLWRDRHGKLYAAILPTSEFEADELGLLLRPVDGRGRYAPWETIHGDPNLGPISLDYRPEPTPKQVAAAMLTPDDEGATR